MVVVSKLLPNKLFRFSKQMFLELIFTLFQVWKNKKVQLALIK